MLIIRAKTSEVYHVWHYYMYLTALFIIQDTLSTQIQCASSS